MTSFLKEEYNNKVLGKITRNTNGTFTMSQKDLMACHERNGIPDAANVFKQISASDETIITAAAEFLKEHVVADTRSCELIMGTGDNRMEVAVAAEKECFNPLKKETMTKYGVVTVRRCNKVPSALRAENSPLFAIAADIEKHMKSLKK